MKEEKVFKPITSSNLLGASYDGTSKLQVKFRNGVYEYEGVTPQVYQDFEATFDKPSSEASSGKYFQQNIKALKFKKL